jgi:hypothetical protein
MSRAIRRFLSPLLYLFEALAFNTVAYHNQRPLPLKQFQ